MTTREVDPLQKPSLFTSFWNTSDTTTKGVVLAASVTTLVLMILAAKHRNNPPTQSSKQVSSKKVPTKSRKWKIGLGAGMAAIMFVAWKFLGLSKTRLGIADQTLADSKSGFYTSTSGERVFLGDLPSSNIIWGVGDYWVPSEKYTTKITTVTPQNEPLWMSCSKGYPDHNDFNLPFPGVLIHTLSTTPASSELYRTSRWTHMLGDQTKVRTTAHHPAVTYFRMSAAHNYASREVPLNIPTIATYLIPKAEGTWKALIDMQLTCARNRKYTTLTIVIENPALKPYYEKALGVDGAFHQIFKHVTFRMLTPTAES